MPKHDVYVERLVPQWIRVTVEADDPEQIPQHADLIFAAACQLDGWKYDDDSQRANKPSTVCLTESPVDDGEPPEIRLSTAKAEVVL